MHAFYDELINAKSVPVKRFEDTHWFECCLPIEETRPPRRRHATIRPDETKGSARPANQCRTLRLCPAPSGKPDGRRLWPGRFSKPSEDTANRNACLKLIPGLENADILQFGQIHRNTFINSPKILNETLATKNEPASSSPARSPVSRAMSNRSRPAGSPG